MALKHPLFYTHYDRLQSDKDYRAEVGGILALYERHSRNKLNRILDVGCGTGSHALELARMGYDVLGVDIDPRMIALARKKQKAERDLLLDFRCAGIARVKEKGFQLAVSLFNVVNYIQDTKRLFAFFQSIRERLIRGGIFLFDVWNGVAALRELPGTREKVITLDHETLRCTVEAATDLMEQKTVLRYLVRVCALGRDRRFEHEMEHFLWTPRCLRDLLGMAHLHTLEVLPFMQQDREAGPSDWKITFVARRA